MFSSLLKKWQLKRPVADKKKKTAYVDSRWMSGPALPLLNVDPNDKQVRGGFCLPSYQLHLILWVTRLEVKILQSGLQRKCLT